RQPVPRAGPPSGQAQPTGVGLPRRRSHRRAPRPAARRGARADRSDQCACLPRASFVTCERERTEETLLKFETKDRRRAAVATVATLLALPALWVVNHNTQDRSPSAPNVAAVGVDEVDGDDEPTPPASLDRRFNL